MPDSAIPKPTGNDLYGAITQPENGAIYDKKPFRLTLEKGKTYSWCLCGKSKSQVNSRTLFLLFLAYFLATNKVVGIRSIDRIWTETKKKALKLTSSIRKFCSVQLYGMVPSITFYKTDPIFL